MRSTKKHWVAIYINVVDQAKEKTLEVDCSKTCHKLLWSLPEFFCNNKSCL